MIDFNKISIVEAKTNITLPHEIKIGIEKFKDTYKIIYKCDKCNKIHKNIMANDDDMDLIIELSKNTNLS